MATIRTAIQIQDGLSQAFKAMNVAMQATINSFEHLQRASGNAVDVSSIEIARRELARAEQAFDQIETQISQANIQQNNLNNSIQNGTSAANAMLSKMLAIVGAYLSFQSVMGIIDLSDEMTNTTARLNLMNDGLQTTAQLQRMIYESAQRTYAPYQATADMVGKLGLQAAAAFSSNEEIVAFAEQLNKTFSNSGTSAEGIRSVMLQLTQAMAAGRLQGEELNAILDNAQPIVANIQRYLEDAFNIDASNIKKLAADGIITAEIIKKAMFYAAEDTNAAFESMPITWSQIWTKMKNYAVDAFSPILLKINKVANSTRMQELMNSMTNSLYTIAGVATAAFDIMTSVGAFVYDNWSLIAPIIGTATSAVLIYVGALTAMKLAQMATVAWSAISATASLIYAAAMGTGTGATWAMVAASLGLNAALAANPIFWVIMAIILLIGLFYVAVAAVNHFAGTSISATGVVAGVFLALGATIANVFIYIWNVAMEAYANIYNVAVTVAEGLVNVFSGDLSAIGRMFVQLGDNVLGILESIARGIDFVFGSNLASAVGGWRSNLESWSAEVLGENKYQIDRMVASDFQMKTFDITDAYNTGHDWGANLFEGGAQKQSNKQAAAIDWESLMNNLGESPSSKEAAEKTAGNTAKMAKSMDGTANELKYLRDLADREAINRYTTAEIKVDMKNENHINSEMDIDGVIDRFGEKVEEVVAVLAEGDDTDV
ncbi:tape measure protein [Solibacillus sp. A46]|uniref:Tape measure protein n=1 Tax=Solibacillus faecavium TaxID=2762221 RepID=A0ABR8XYS4_9BACL|nr:tape measure protein [Solibacillus faecavium]MBD8037083.1 tape measure protein [Solibacillus faecavium]